MESGDIAPCSMVKWSQYVHKHLLPAWGPTYIQRRQCVILSVCCCGIFLFRTGCQLTTWSVSVAQDSHWHQVTLIATTSSKCLCQRRTRPRYILHCKGQVVWVTGSKKNFLPLSFPLLWRPLRLVVTASWLRLKKKGMNKEISVDFHKKPDLHIEQTTSICSAHQWERFFFSGRRYNVLPKKLAVVIMTPAILSATKTGGGVFSIGFSQQHIPSQRNSLTTIQLLFLRWNKGGLCCLSVREAEPPQANTPHGWRTVIVYTSIHTIAADMKTGSHE